MELKIYDKQGIVKMTVSPDNSSQWNHEVGVENVVTVNFTTWEFLVLEVGWYILVENQKFSIKSEYRPKHIHDTKYTYNLKFYGREHDAQDILFCRLNQGEDDLESVFAYDGTPMDFLQKVVANMNRNTDGVVWKAGEAISANRQTINFNGLYCWDALSEIARAFGSEWWMDGEYLNISKCERGESVSLGYGQGLKSGLTQNENTNAVKWFTRLIPVGSSKNIDKSKYGYATLQLPGREKYIDINTQYGLKEYREEAAFSEIYPHRVGAISSVRAEERTNEETGNYTVYYVKDSSLPFNPDEYMIGGEVVHMTFNSGALAGKDFEVNWNNETKEFEIINQYPDENTQLPGGNLVPSADDTYVLWNISMPDEYIRAAEQELKEAVDVYLAEYSKDISVYSGNTDYIYISKNNVPLLLGQRIRLLSEIYFGNIGRDSRITRVSRKLNNLNEATIDCSDAIASSWKSSVDSSLNQLQFSVAKELAQTVIEILKTGDSGIPSDYNVLSSLRSLRTFLRKDQPDNAAGLITFLKGLSSKDDVIIGSEGYAEGMTGFGTKFSRDGSGEMSRLTLRHELRVPSLVFNQTEVNVGDKWRAPGGGCIERVIPDVDAQGNILNTGTFWIKLEKGQIGAVFSNAICMGIFHDWENTDNNATEDYDDSRGNRTYAGFTTSYFTITEISDYTDEEGVTYSRKQCRYQIRPISDRWSGQAHPYEQMNFVCYGIFSSDAEMLKKYGTSVYETRTYRRMLWNQNTWEIASSNIAYQDGDLSNLNIHGMDMEGYSAYLNSVYFTGTIKQVKPDGTPVRTANEKGAWKAGEKSEYYDRFSHLGGLWLCIAEGGTNTEPKIGDPAWLCEVKPGESVTPYGPWNTKSTPYKVSSIVTFASKVWISNKETSEPPFPIYTDNEGNRLLFNDGGYIIASLVQSDDWYLLLDAPAITNGKDGESVQLRYSSNKTNWHDVYVTGDKWLQQRVGENAQWSDPIPFVGEAGAAGKDGTYYDYQFAVNDSLDVAPTTGWQDTPPAVGVNQFLWVRTRFVDPNSTEENPWSTARVGGEKGDKGDSVSNMGAWKTGMAVPYLGMVTMGGCTFMAKVATTNPPMWCYTDKDGNRLLFADGGYVLTGELNTEEYELLMQNGKDGRDGQKGDKGDKGEQGIQGCIIRDSEWVIGTQYRNDETLTNGIRYIDVVLVRNDSATTGWDAYKCKVTHFSSADKSPGNTTYWEEFGSNIGSIFTSLVIAKNAKINFLQGNQLLIHKSNGKVTAGISGSEEGKKVRFWAGSEQPDNAPFMVFEDGTLIATKAEITGEVNATSGVFENVTISGTFRTPWKELVYRRIYSSATTDIYGFDGSAVSDDKVEISPIVNCEILIGWGNVADGREVTIRVNNTNNSRVYVNVPTGYFAIDINGNKISEGERLYLSAGYIYYLTGCRDCWIVNRRVTVVGNKETT